MMHFNDKHKTSLHEESYTNVHKLLPYLHCIYQEIDPLRIGRCCLSLFLTCVCAFLRE